MQNQVSHSQKDGYARAMYLRGRVLAWHAQDYRLILRTTKPNKEETKRKKTNTSYGIHSHKIPRNRK